MRLWHQELIPYLSTQRLLGQHRECCALRGKGWGRKHKTVDYVFTHPMQYLYMYHKEVMSEMDKRGYKYDFDWSFASYRGKHLERDYSLVHPTPETFEYLAHIDTYKDRNIYPEHNDEYLKECLDLLEKRGEHIEWKNIK